MRFKFTSAWEEGKEKYHRKTNQSSIEIEFKMKNFIFKIFQFYYRIYNIDCFLWRGFEIVGRMTGFGLERERRF
jgi:hypothetical protein